jgi:hypothetical protein
MPNTDRRSFLAALTAILTAPMAAMVGRKRFGVAARAREIDAAKPLSVRLDEQASYEAWSPRNARGPRGPSSGRTVSRG